ncbi:MAG: ATP-binding protein [Pseudomonadota bacterium]
MLSLLKTKYWPETREGAELRVASERTFASFCVLAGISGTLVSITNIPYLAVHPAQVVLGQVIALGFLLGPTLINGRRSFGRRVTLAGYGAMALFITLSLSLGMLISSTNLLLLPAIAAFTLILGWRFGLLTTAASCGAFVFGFVSEAAATGGQHPDPAYLVSLICGSIILFLGSTIYRREMQRAANRIEAERERALEADKAKSEFLAMMSHEIRTPMNGVIGMLQLLTMSKMPEADQEHAEIALHSAHSLLSILNDILDYSKNEAGGLEIKSEPFDPAELATEVTDLFRPLASAKQVAVNLHGLDGLPARVLSDRDRVRQVLSNLISNAVKFTDTGSVDVTVKHTGNMDGGRLQIEVRDTGIGIPDSEAAAVFDRFKQVETSNSRRHGGTGLGLAICRQITEHMDGTISLERNAGGGSCFRFDIPCPATASDVSPSTDDPGALISQTG